MRVLCLANTMTASAKTLAYDFRHRRPPPGVVPSRKFQFLSSRGFMSTNAASSLQQTLSDIVLADSRAAAVFDRLGLDYCCHGHQTLEEAAAAEGVDVDRAVVDLEALGPARPEDRAAGDALELDALTRQIVSRYHQRAREMTVAITAWLDKLVN